MHPSLRGQALVARTVARAMTELDAPLAVDADAVAALPDWQTYADRRGANPYARYAAAHRMRLLGTVGFFARSNPEMSPDAAAVCAQIESTQPAPIVRRLRAWADPEGRLVDDVPVRGLDRRARCRHQAVKSSEAALRFAASLHALRVARSRTGTTPSSASAPRIFQGSSKVRSAPAARMVGSEFTVGPGAPPARRRTVGSGSRQAARRSAWAVRRLHPDLLDK
ncbi:MAG: hypothetical protein R3B49_09870 [Phycisphaerales bacterium]